MDEEDGANQAIEELNGHEMGGRKMKVNYLRNFFYVINDKYILYLYRSVLYVSLYTTVVWIWSISSF